MKRAARVPPALWAETMQRDHFACQRCGSAADEVHHRVYRSRGGPHDLLNMVALCRRCHQDVHAGSLSPWVVAGYFLHGQFVGEDPAYLAHYGDGRRAA